MRKEAKIKAFALKNLKFFFIVTDEKKLKLKQL